MKLLSKGPSLLLISALALAGAKSPIAFSAWSIAVLVYAIGVIGKQRLSWPITFYVLLFASGVILSQAYSLDPTNSLYGSVQILVFSFLWLALYMSSPSIAPEDFWYTLWGLGAITALLTSWQWIRHEPAYGLLPLNPNFNAIWMAVIAVAFTAKKRITYAELFIVLWLATLVVIGRSRSGLLALLCGVLYATRGRYSRRSLYLGVGILLATLLMIPPTWLMNRMYLFENGGRLRIWGIALRSLMDYPLTGYGLGNFELAYHRYAFPIEEAVRYSRTTSFAHNDYLQILSELGLPTAGLLLVAFFNILFKPVRSEHPLAVPAKAMLISLGVAACFNPVFKMPILLYLALLSASFLTDPLPPHGKIPKTTYLWPRPVSYCVFGSLVMVSAWCGIRSYWALHQKWDCILQWNSADGEAWHERAYQTADKNMALVYHEKAVQESPYQPYYVEGLAHTLENRPEAEFYPQALQMYLRAIQLAPTRAINYLAMARLLWRAGEYAAALQWTEKARALEPYYWEGDLWKARCLASLGAKKHAIFVLKNLTHRREAFLKIYADSPPSPYEQTILGYDPTVIRKELLRLHDLVPNGVK